MIDKVVLNPTETEGSTRIVPFNGSKLMTLEMFLIYFVLFFILNSKQNESERFRLLMCS